MTSTISYPPRQIHSLRQIPYALIQIDEKLKNPSFIVYQKFNQLSQFFGHLSQLCYRFNLSANFRLTKPDAPLPFAFISSLQQLFKERIIDMLPVRTSCETVVDEDSIDNLVDFIFQENEETNCIDLAKTFYLPPSSLSAIRNYYAKDLPLRQNRVRKLLFLISQIFLSTKLPNSVKKIILQHLCKIQQTFLQTQFLIDELNTLIEKMFNENDFLLEHLLNVFLINSSQLQEIQNEIPEDASQEIILICKIQGLLDIIDRGSLPLAIKEPLSEKLQELHQEQISQLHDQLSILIEKMFNENDFFFKDLLSAFSISPSELQAIQRKIPEHPNQQIILICKIQGLLNIIDCGPLPLAIKKLLTQRLQELHKEQVVQLHNVVLYFTLHESHSLFGHLYSFGISYKEGCSIVDQISKASENLTFNQLEKKLYMSLWLAIAAGTMDKTLKELVITDLKSIYEESTPNPIRNIQDLLQWMRSENSRLSVRYLAKKYSLSLVSLEEIRQSLQSPEIPQHFKRSRAIDHLISLLENGRLNSNTKTSLMSYLQETKTLLSDLHHLTDLILSERLNIQDILQWMYSENSSLSEHPIKYLAKQYSLSFDSLKEIRESLQNQKEDPPLVKRLTAIEHLTSLIANSKLDHLTKKLLMSDLQKPRNLTEQQKELIDSFGIHRDAFEHMQLLLAQECIPLAEQRPQKPMTTAIGLLQASRQPLQNQENPDRLILREIFGIEFLISAINQGELEVKIKLEAVQFLRSLKTFKESRLKNRKEGSSSTELATFQVLQENYHLEQLPYLIRHILVSPSKPTHLTKVYQLSSDEIFQIQTTLQSKHFHRYQQAAIVCLFLIRFISDPNKFKDQNIIKQQIIQQFIRLFLISYPSYQNTLYNPEYKNKLGALIRRETDQVNCLRELIEELQVIDYLNSNLINLVGQVLFNSNSENFQTLIKKYLLSEEQVQEIRSLTRSSNLSFEQKVSIAFTYIDRFISMSNLPFEVKNSIETHLKHPNTVKTFYKNKINEWVTLIKNPRMNTAKLKDLCLLFNITDEEYQNILGVLEEYNTSSPQQEFDIAIIQSLITIMQPKDVAMHERSLQSSQVTDQSSILNVLNEWLTSLQSIHERVLKLPQLIHHMRSYHPFHHPITLFQELTKEFQLSFQDLNNIRDLLDKSLIGEEKLVIIRFLREHFNRKNSISSYDKSCYNCMLNTLEANEIEEVESESSSAYFSEASSETSSPESPSGIFSPRIKY